MYILYAKYWMGQILVARVEAERRMGQKSILEKKGRVEQQQKREGNKTTVFVIFSPQMKLCLII
jgi:hypothetical protein